MVTDGVCVIIVSYNTIDALRRCLGCIEPHHQTIVVDNASFDGSAEMVVAEFPSVELIRSRKNLGFGPANNVGHALATKDLVLYLNSDAYAFPGAIDLLIEAFHDPQVVAAGGKLLNLDQTNQLSTAEELTLWRVFCEQTFLDKIIQKMGVGYWNTPQLLSMFESNHLPVRTPQVTGACLMVKRSVTELFDPTYFLYCEDTDLCKRLSRHGTIVYLPTAQFTHELGTSSNTNRWLSVARYNLGKEIYFGIHQSRRNRSICWAFNRLGALIRLTGWLIATVLTLGAVPKFRNQVGLFGRVLTAKSESLDPRN